MRLIIVASFLFLCQLLVFQAVADKQAFENKQAGIETYSHWWNMPSTIVWDYMEDPPYPCIAGTGTCINGKFYIIGGQSNQYGQMSYVQIWDGANWSMGASYPYDGLAQHTATVWNNKIVISYPFFRTYTSVYDPITNTWQANSTPMGFPDATEGCSATANGKCYIFGGSVLPICPLDLVFEWTPGDAQMVQKKGMPIPLFCQAAASYNGNIYIFGGSTSDSPSMGDSDIILKYNPIADTWTECSSHLSIPRRELRATALGDKIYLLGGKHQGQLNIVEIFDPVTDTITVGESMPQNASRGECDGYLSLNKTTYTGRLYYHVGGYAGPTLSFNGSIGDIELIKVEPSTVGLIKAIYR